MQWTGRRISPDRHRWLAGPIGKPTGVGAQFFDAYAAESQLRLDRAAPCGLLPSFRDLAGPTFDPGGVAESVASFYERTSEYDLDVWSQWCGAFRPFGALLATMFSRRLQQLNVPLSGLDTSRGMVSEVFSVRDRQSDEALFTAWVRRLVSTGSRHLRWRVFLL